MSCYLMSAGDCFHIIDRWQLMFPRSWDKFRGLIVQVDGNACVLHVHHQKQQFKNVYVIAGQAQSSVGCSSKAAQSHMDDTHQKYNNHCWYCSLHTNTHISV
jgi:hypothetical protein